VSEFAESLSIPLLLAIAVLLSTPAAILSDIFLGFSTADAMKAQILLAAILFTALVLHLKSDFLARRDTE
jgi:hypothetical protein